VRCYTHVRIEDTLPALLRSEHGVSALSAVLIQVQLI